MRPLMRNALIGVGLVMLALLALGALPGYLGSGPQYYLEATPTDDTGTAVNVTEFSERRYPYLTGALAADNGRSEGYQRGLDGFKDTFSHTPFDELDSLRQLGPDAVRDGGDRVIIETTDDRYSVQIVSEADR